MEIYNPKVLLISHNVFSKNINMGKTLSTYFEGWDKSKIAQLYFHKEVPTTNVCKKYYRFTDVDAIKSIIFRGYAGRALVSQDIQQARDDASDTGRLNRLYNYGKKRTPLIYLLRDSLWRLSSWESKSLIKWIRDFDPEVIFFASGDYAFSYRIALRIAEAFRLPMVTCCFDDYYIFNQNAHRWFGKRRHRLFMDTVWKTMERSQIIFTVTDLMSEAYSKMFAKPCSVLYTGTNLQTITKPCGNKKGIAYLGGLSLKRYESLVDIGRTLMKINHPLVPKELDVYSGESNSDVLRHMTKSNGINFHGFISSEKIHDIISKCVAVVHTESFDSKLTERVRYSLSTKIPDSLASGTCLFVYGPKGVASIDYLYRNQAAFVCNNKSELQNKLVRLFVDESLREEIVKKALQLAARNHDSRKIPAFVQKNLIEAINMWKDQYGEVNT